LPILKGVKGMSLLLGGHPTAGATMAKCLPLVLLNNIKGRRGRKVHKKVES